MPTIRLSEWWELRQWDEDDDSPRDAGLGWVLTEKSHRRFASRAEAEVIAAESSEENRPAPSRSED